MSRPFGLRPNDNVFIDIASLGAVTVTNQGSTVQIGIKAPVRLATVNSGNLIVSYVAGQLIDGVVLQLGDRILVKNQLNMVENGVYIVTNGMPLRSQDAALGMHVAGVILYVNEGVMHGDTQWSCINDGNNDVIGVDQLAFVELTGGMMPNLTGVITSVGSVTSIASQTGTGGTIVVNTSPNLISPTISTPPTLASHATRKDYVDLLGYQRTFVDNVPGVKIYTPTVGTRRIRVTLYGGGGCGGAGIATPAQRSSLGAGGSRGGIVQFWDNVDPTGLTSYNYTIGSTGTQNLLGINVTVPTLSTITIGVNVYVAEAGLNGVPGVILANLVPLYVQGTGPGAAVNACPISQRISMQSSYASTPFLVAHGRNGIACSGDGDIVAGIMANGVGRNGIGYGGSGSGGFSYQGVAQLGGAGQNGAIVIEEM